MKKDYQPQLMCAEAAPMNQMKMAGAGYRRDNAQKLERAYSTP
jgi:hypothetical protein